jgi:predicted metalloprotease with PDZ domain
LREAYRRFSGARGFREEEFRALASGIAGRDLGEFFRRAVDSADELDYAPALDWFGLRFRAAGAPGEGTQAPRRGWLGASIEESRGRLLVTEVLRETPAFRAGLAVDDELLAIGGFRVAPAQWPARLEAFPPGSRAALTVARRERLIELAIEFGEEPDPRRWRLEVDPEAGEAAAERRAAWLGPPGSTSTAPVP